MNGAEGLSPDAQRLFEALVAEREAPAGGDTPREAPLSLAQERLWALGELAAGTAWGNLPIVFRVAGPVDVDALAAAIGDVVSRHEPLRTRYEATADGPVARVLDPDPSPLATESVAGVDEAMVRIAEEAARPIDPGRDPAFRARWLARPEGGWLFLLAHHLATDGWSLGLLLREISAAYAARVEGRAPDFEPIRTPFGRLAAAERMGPGPDEAQIAYWRSRLAGAPREIPLPGPSGAPDYRSGVRSGALGAEDSAALRRVAAGRGVTPFGAWLGVIGSTLAAYASEPDIVLGTTISDRGSAEREGLVGNFGNNLLLRGRFDPERSFEEVLSGIRETLPRDLAHQSVPIETLVRRVSGLPRLHVLFMLRDGSPDDHFGLAGCETAYVPVHAGASTLDLIVDVQDLGSAGFAFTVEHRLARIEEPEAARFVEDLARVAEAVARQPGRPCGELPVERGRWRTGGAGEQAGATGAGPGVAGSGPGAASDPGRDEAREESDLTPGEAVLVAVWREALELERVDPYDNFFELGGHSLLAIDVLERVEERTGVRLTPVDLVSQTLGQLAGALDEAMGVGEGAEATDAPGDEAQGGWLGRLRRARGTS